MIKNKKILITGGTGSLGKALARELGEYNHVVIYSRNEERQYEMMKEFNNPNLTFRIGDVRDTETLKFALRGCDFAIHAAAMKDLIMVEEQPTQGYLNNILGSKSFIQAVIETPSVIKAVGISTDKAASPSNAYGMTKYLMERLFVEANHNSEKTFVCTRFGNIIDSHGSLITFWKDHQDTDIKLHHEGMRRFFFKLTDAVKVVLDAIQKAEGGEIFIPKMKQASILAILQTIFKRESFEIVGISPGEKIDEDLIGESERYFTHEQEDYYVVKPGKPNVNPPAAFSTANAESFTKEELEKLIFD